MVVTKPEMNFKSDMKNISAYLLALIALISLPLYAAVLPDERVDALEHNYNGGGIEVSGPSVLVRKNIGNSVSVSANYYVDMVSSASIDVLASASKYSEERKQKSIGFDYLHERTTYSISYITSDENDYHAKTYNLGASQTFFGDLTTLGFGFTYGQDVVGRNIKGVPDPDFHLDKDRFKYNLSLSQIVTKNMIANLSLESGSEACVHMQEGQSCLNNPYRGYSYLSNGVRALLPEKYPLTHNSDAAGLQVVYHLPYSAAIRFDGRIFKDSWGVKAHNEEIRYTQDFKKDLLLELKYRVYSQTAADFYSDLFPYKDAQNYMARDKELSPFSSTSFGVGLSYTFHWNIPGIDKSTANLYWDHINIQYDDFRDYANFVQVKAPNGGYKVGEEPLYRLDADVIRFFISFWY